MNLLEEKSFRANALLDTEPALSPRLTPAAVTVADSDRLTEVSAVVPARHIRSVSPARPKVVLPKDSRIPSLDGFRALSIMMVLLHHATKTALFPRQMTATLRYMINGNLGVRIFFVISGLLITTLLLKEEDRKGNISLALFYERRAARILPVFWAYILAVFVYSAVCGLIVPARPFVEALTFSTSWFHTHQWVFEHSWSLSVEEAFYLVWPLGVALLPFKGRLALALAVIAAGPMVRVLLYHVYGGYGYFTWFSLGLLGNLDPIMWGCLLALIHHRYPALLKRLASWRPFVLHALGALVMLALLGLNQPAFWFLTIPFTVTVSCLVVVYLVTYHCFISDGVGFRVLNHSWVARIGILSYSIYLWQQLFLQPAELHRFWWQAYPANLPLCLLAAGASYYVLERPFLRFRARLREA